MRWNRGAEIAVFYSEFSAEVAVKFYSESRLWNRGADIAVFYSEFSAEVAVKFYSEFILWNNTLEWYFETVLWKCAEFVLELRSDIHTKVMEQSTELH